MAGEQTRNPREELVLRKHTAISPRVCEGTNLRCLDQISPYNACGSISIKCSRQLYTAITQNIIFQIAPNHMSSKKS